MSGLLTAEQFRKALPPQVKKSVNQELIDKVNQTISDPAFREVYRDNLLGYANVMSKGKFKIQSYLDAVRYVSYKLLGDSNIVAYTKTFPDKYQDFITRGVDSKDIASYVTAYNKSKLVNLIYEQSLVPSWVLNQDLYQKALNVQAELMITAQSEKVRTDAANSILTHLKMPETQKVELEVGMKEDSTIQALRESTAELVRQQRLMMQSGAMDAQEVAHTKLAIEGEFREVGNE
ncbi:hypothetical protein [Marinobacterium litorale]|uniref:hypothetical protein n=1 Tax=Marinobacterium litorale TaxID=404770 RepID=UPI0004219C0D|nr:hypothetical protein [Marinobacterium litorale]